MAVSNTISTAERQGKVDAHHQASATYWRDVYAEESLDAVFLQQRRELVLSLIDDLGVPSSAQFLEVGCGAGLTTVDLARRGFNVHAVDTLSSMLDLAQQASRDAGVAGRIRLSRGDANALPFADNTFSVAISMGVTTCLDSPHQALREMARVLEPGGYLIVNAENRWRLNHLFDPLLFPALAPLRRKLHDTLAAPAKPRLRMHSIREFDSALRRAGLTKLRGMTLGFGPFTIFNHTVLPERAGVKLHHHLQKLADRGFPVVRSTGVQYIVVARKEAR